MRLAPRRAAIRHAIAGSGTHERRPQRAPRVPFAVLVVALIGGGLVLLLALNTASAANELRRHDLAGRDASVAAQVQQLRVDVAASAAPDKLAEVAAALGMVPATNPAFLIVGPDGSLRVLGSPAPASAAPLVQATKRTKKVKPTKTATASSTATTTKSASATPHGSPSAARSSATPRPTTQHPTPTPTVTLPGGNR